MLTDTLMFVLPFKIVKPGYADRREHDEDLLSPSNSHTTTDTVIVRFESYAWKLFSLPCVDGVSIVFKKSLSESEAW
jgi:hypothetical protein